LVILIIKQSYLAMKLPYRSTEASSWA